MNLYGAAWHISDLLESNRSVFIKLNPEVPDHTTRAPFKMHLCGVNKILELDITHENIMGVMGQFDYTIFDKERVDRLYVWNIKALATYFRVFCDKYIKPNNSVIDLKVVENFLGVKKKAPENLPECIDRVRSSMNHKGWMAIYKSIHLPLTLKVLPSIEAMPLLDEATRQPVYPYYEVEGQIYGRMNTLKKYSHGYAPHNMGPDVRYSLKPRGYGMRFLTADYRHCEVTVLQWLSGDTTLKELLNSGRDLHEAIYEELTGDKCDTDAKRKISKSIFLPVMYGCGASTLAANVGIPEAVAKELINRLKAKFHKAWDWMHHRQEEARKGVIADHFGRPRLFKEEECYLARNFSVQGTAATVCQEKLIELFGKLDRDKAYIAYSVYDGYGLVVQVKAAREVYRLVKDTLEAESKICPGLKMKVEIKFGMKLAEMKVLWKD